MTATVLLNIDLGELPDESPALYAFADVASIACGGHAGDVDSMRCAVERCRASGTRVGAHPSYPDREGFGRQPMEFGAPALRAVVAEQCARLVAIATAAGEPVVYVKAHGALYHAAREQAATAEAVLDAVLDVLGTGAVVIGPAHGELARAAAHKRLQYAREAFADRGALPDGTLIPRDRPGALLLDPADAAARARVLASRGDVDTLCVHGDTPGAVDVARAVRAALDTLRRP
ncbi:MAG: LamB/YcsF family protein [Myxococcota bacterium]|nr:LamB/YcsF family protein [Myxococcota bacterium]